MSTSIWAWCHCTHTHTCKYCIINAQVLKSGTLLPILHLSCFYCQVTKLYKVTVTLTSSFQNISTSNRFVSKSTFLFMFWTLRRLPQQVSAQNRTLRSQPFLVPFFRHPADPALHGWLSSMNSHSGHGPWCCPEESQSENFNSFGSFLSDYLMHNHRTTLQQACP